jgi:hypothetical protein
MQWTIFRWAARVIGILLDLIGLAGIPDDWKTWTEKWHVLDFIVGDAGRWFLVVIGTVLVLWSWDIPKKLAAAYRAAKTDPEGRLTEVSEQLRESEANARTLSDKLKALGVEAERYREAHQLARVKLNAEEKNLEKSESARVAAQADLAVIQHALEGCQSDLNNCKSELQSVKAERKELGRVLDERRVAWLRRLLSDCGSHEPESKKHSVLIQYVRPDDLELARQIRRHFIHEDSRTPWIMAAEVDQVVVAGTRRNSSESADIVVFYDDQHRFGIARAIQELTGRRAAGQQSRPDKDADVEVVIFGTRRNTTEP